MALPRTMIAIAALLTLVLNVSAKAELLVVASIKPVHSLVAAVMEGVAEPELLIDGAASPHNFSLKPSQARTLEKASIIFWISRHLESFMEKPVATVGAKARSVELFETQGIEKLAIREGGAFQSHHHDHGDQGEESDVHIWLDPANAIVMAGAIEKTLSTTDPANASRYRKNADILIRKLENLTGEIANLLAPVRDRPFVVFHDGYHYFERRFDIEATAAITINPEVKPGVERIREIRSAIRDNQATCIFAEPQFNAQIVSVITEGTPARVYYLDPVGAGLDNGPELYPSLLRNLAQSLLDCLSDNS